MKFICTLRTIKAKTQNGLNASKVVKAKHLYPNIMYTTSFYSFIRALNSVKYSSNSNQHYYFTNSQILVIEINIIILLTSQILQ